MMVSAPEKSQINTNFTYRPDLDGLRAVAVLLVVFEHLRTRVTGGYIGVDVFFVISGYLISSVIISDMTSGSFSLAKFYERRIRRIVPALLVMILVVALLAYRCFVPSEITAFAWSALAAQFSVSNLLFAHQTGYFDAPSTFKPLLHTWSLAVEEQFYLLFPIFLVVVRPRAARRLNAAIWIVVVLSFAVACIWVRRDPTVAFYFAPLRAWELLIGTIVSQRFVPAVHNKVYRNLAAAVGMLLILVPGFVYTGETQFPGLAALPPCLGTALVIWTGETGTSFIHKLLSFRPLVFVGLISYSLYLWHWPILVFQKTNLLLVDAPMGSKRVQIAVFGVSFLVAVLSWQLIETPFRKGRFRPGRRSLFVVSGTAFASLGFVAFYMIVTNGISSRFNGEALEVSRYTSFDPSQAYREKLCHLEPDDKFSTYRPDICLKNDSARKHYLLLGDSHGAQLYLGLSTVFPEINFSQATVAQCRPFVTPAVNAKPDCLKMLEYVYREYLVHHHVDEVLLAGRWQEDEIPELEHTVSWIEQHGMSVIVFGPNIEFDQSLPRIMAISLRDRDSSAISRHRAVQPQLLDRKLALIARNEWKVRYISIYEDLCEPARELKTNENFETDSKCPMRVEAGVPLLFDTDHLTPRGSVLFAEAVRARSQFP
jgi:peptidoglycan/LPS O-acetylase OafA/YrhL